MLCSRLDSIVSCRVDEKQVRSVDEVNRLPEGMWKEAWRNGHSGVVDTCGNCSGWLNSLTIMVKDYSVAGSEGSAADAREGSV